MNIVVAALAILILAGTSQPPAKNADTAVPPKQQTESEALKQPPAPDQRGTDQQPLVVKALKPPETAAEADQEQSDRAEKNSADLWMIRLTGALVAVGVLQAVIFGFQLYIFGLQARRLRETIEKMDEVAAGQTSDMSDAIKQSTRAATAMEGVAKSMASNVEYIKKSVSTTKDIAARQKQLGELQTRAYAVVNYVGIVPQNRENSTRFEPRLTIVGNGLTPAYKLKFWAKSDILPFPLPNGFIFPESEYGMSPSVGVLGPRNTFTISATIPSILSDGEISQIKAGNRLRIYIWGVVIYEDAFKIPRYVKFAQSILWFADGVTTTSFNTAEHNDAN